MLCNYGDIKSSSPSLPYIPLSFFIFHPFIDSLPSPSLRPPSLSTLPSSYLPPLLPFPVPSLVPYITLSVLTFPFPTQSSPFPPNLPWPYLSSFLSISFPTCLLAYLSPSYLSTSLPSPTLPLFPSLSFPPLGSLISPPPQGGKEFYSRLNPLSGPPCCIVQPPPPHPKTSCWDIHSVGK